jgi:DNA (cytosine-5)-methyltransferase 1
MHAPSLQNQTQRSVELFAGAGGLALGIAAAGFHHEAFIERDKDTCLTVQENQSRGLHPIAAWPLTFGDVKDMDYSQLKHPIDLVAGGPPCQPFSLGGKHGGFNDERDGFPEAVRAVRELRPRAFIFENVKGLLRESFATYFEYVQLQLTYPDLERHGGETWSEHLSRLERHHTAKGSEPEYQLVYRLVNAADYGVPQRRERVFIVGFRSDQRVSYSFPEPTHAQDALLHSQWISGEYWERHQVARRERPEPGSRATGRIERLRSALPLFLPQPWQTVRDAIADLPDPETDPRAEQIPNHWANPGARSYPGHTGSPHDEPAKTLKAGDHGVPGGENTLAFPCGRVRYFTVRESARLQTFPDEYIFPRSWTESMRQLGNAVPVRLASVIATSISQAIGLLPSRRNA